MAGILRDVQRIGSHRGQRSRAEFVLNGFARDASEQCLSRIVAAMHLLVRSDPHAAARLAGWLDVLDTSGTVRSLDRMDGGVLHGLPMLCGTRLQPEIEVAIAVGVLNRMLDLGRPEYVRIG